MKYNLKIFPKLEDWAYRDLLAFYTKAIDWKINHEKELREMEDCRYCRIKEEILGE